MSLRSARLGLMGQGRAFFETHLNGIFSWDGVVHRPAEPLKPLPNGRRNPLGKFIERVAVTFGGFELTIESPEQHPPLGWVSCVDDESGEIEQGPLDIVIWKNIGDFIKCKIEEQVDG